MQFFKQQVKTLGRRLGMVTGLYFLSRLLFIAFNAELFHIEDFAQGFQIILAGFRFDIAAILITNSALIIASIIPNKKYFTKNYQVFLSLLYLPVNIVAIVANLSDIIYIRFTLKRTTLDFVDMFADDGGLFKLLPQFLLDFWYIFLIGLVFIWLLFRCFFKMSLKYKTSNFQHSKVLLRNKLPKLNDVVLCDNKSKNIGIAVATARLFGEVSVQKNEFKWSSYFLTMPKFFFKEILTGLFIIGITIIGIRGGTQLRPIGIMTASKYTGPELAPVILNTPFTLIKSSGKQKLTEYHFFKEKELQKIYSPIHHPKANQEFRPLNIVMIIMESLSKEHIGYLNQDISNYQGFTPFLDSLFQHGLICTQAYANGKRSIDGIPAVTAGFPTMMENPLNSSIYSSNKFSSLASLLKKKGYQTAFFHGGNNGTMGFDQFTKAIGYDAYYGRDEYGNDEDFDGKWGIFDEPYFQYFGKQLNSYKQPFMATIFSLSSHHPYTIPEQYIEQFPKGKLPIQECIAYSDFALQEFFKYAKKQEWYQNTLFVITADHCSEVAMESYNTDWGKYAIPIFYYMPSDSLQGHCERTTQQIDILPSVLDYLNYDKEYFALGESVFDNTSLGFSISYLNYNYQLIHGNQIIKTDLKTNYNYEHFGNVSILKEIKPKSLENFLKAFVQTYNNRMIHNKMVKDY